MMTPFQMLTLAVFGSLLVFELRGLMITRSGRRLIWIRLAAWTAAALAITFPEWLATVAWALGIGRAADVVLYTFALAGLGAFFFYYSWALRLEQQVTRLVRYQAIIEARQGKSSPVASAFAGRNSGAGEG